MSAKFRFEPGELDANPSNSVVVYRPEEYSFDTTPSSVDSYASLLFGDLNLDLSIDGKVLSVWGLSASSRWGQSSLSVPKAVTGSLFYETVNELVAGSSLRLIPRDELIEVIDLEQGWFRTAGTGVRASVVSISPQVLVELDAADRAFAIWINPLSLDL